MKVLYPTFFWSCNVLNLVLFNFIDIAVLLGKKYDYMYPPNTKYINTQVQFLSVMTGICKMHKSMKG